MTRTGRRKTAQALALRSRIILRCATGMPSVAVAQELGITDQTALNGVRNRDLQRLCFAQPATTPTEARRRSAWASRKLRLLRAHGLIHKVTGTHRYHLTKAGRTVTTAILTALRSSVRQLTAAAA